MSSSTPNDDLSQELKAMMEQESQISPRKKVWNDLGASAELITDDDDVIADEDKENEDSNPIVNESNNSFSATTQDLHLQLDDSETQDLESATEPLPSCSNKSATKRLAVESILVSDATPEKTRKLDHSVKQEFELFENSNENVDEASEALSQSLVDDNSVVILDDSSIRSLTETQEVIEISTDKIENEESEEKVENKTLTEKTDGDISTDKVEGEISTEKTESNISTDKTQDISIDEKSPRQKSPSLLKRNVAKEKPKSDFTTETSGEESDPKPRSDPSPDEGLADDELSRQLSSSANSGRPGSSMRVDTPELSVSPIGIIPSDKRTKRQQHLLQSQRRTSTPGHKKSPKKSNKDQTLSTPTRSQDSTMSISPETIVEGKGSQPEPTFESSESFKVPGESPNSDMALVCLTVRPNELIKLAQFVNGLTDSKMFIRNGKSFKIIDLFEKAKSFFDESKRRISDISSLSSQSRTSSSTGGYLGDIGSSGSSTLTSGSSSVSSKRDRLSICPDLAIERHNVVSPLPKLKKVFSGSQSVIQEEASNSITTQEFGKTAELENHVAEENPMEEPTAINELKGKEEVESEKPKKSVVAASEIAPVVEEPSTPAASSSSRKRNKKLLPRHIRDSRSRSPFPVASQQSVDTNQVSVASTHQISEGSRVFAKWVERTEIRYWPGVVQSILDEKFIVKFEDNYERTLKNGDLIRVDALEPGHQVNVSSEEDQGIFRVAVLLSHPDLSSGKSGKPDVSYMVEFEPVEGDPQVESRLVSYKLFHLSDEQAKIIKRDLGGQYVTPTLGRGDISLDNLVVNKRRSKANTPLKIATPSRGNSRKRGGDNAETSVVEAESSATESARTKSNKPLAAVKGFISTTEDETGTPSKDRKRKPSSKFTESLFNGMHFILTQSLHLSNEAAAASSCMETETEEEDENELSTAVTTMNKKEVKKVVLDNGGIVLDEFPGAKQKIPEDLIVISDRYCLTMNYLSGIVHGFKLINYQWVIHSVSARSKLPLRNYLLPIGFSAITKKEIEPHEVENLRQLFNNLHILITSVHKTFATDWKPVLTRMGASVSTRCSGTLDRGLANLNLIVADSEAPPTILKDARSKSIPLVSSLWIIQSIINGKKLPFDSFHL